MTHQRFARYAWGLLGYNLLVIAWGAFVRASGSGAGCGSHWPLCNGEVIPPTPALETIIELTHRLTSGLAGLLVIALFVFAYRLYPKHHRTRRAAFWALFFTITEGLIGASLVLFEWVAYNMSLGRVLSISLHLVNTFVLLGFLTLTAWWASGGAPVQWRSTTPSGQHLRRLLWGGVAAMLVLSVAGAITALGDTLFRVDSLAEGLARDFSDSAHLLERLRIWHPILAVFTGAYLIFLARRVSLHRPHQTVQRFHAWLIGLVVTQWVAGLVNVFLLAPVWMQLVHLLLADLLWIVLVLLMAQALAVPQRADAHPMPPANPETQPVGL